MILCMECACTSLLHIESIQVLVIVTVYWVPILYKELYRFVSYREVFYYNLAGEIGHVYYSQSDHLKNSWSCPVVLKSSNSYEATGGLPVLTSATPPCTTFSFVL